MFYNCDVYFQLVPTESEVRKALDRSNAGFSHLNFVRNMNTLPAFLFSVALPCGGEGHPVN
jgi:hypothetical protein